MTSKRHSLADLPVGASAVITAVGCPRVVARRLMEMGLLPGTPVAVTRVAPLGDPIVLRLRGYSLSIRRQEAAFVLVEDVRMAVAARAAVERTVP
ncbi:MAG: ferrous iron transport protein A [Sandaracinaceae bacterium]|nr:ferrous iron transport protein A [Sandaracinaceae bacterium]